MSALAEIRSALNNAVSIEPAQAARFFKTGLGGYAEKDIFMGVTVPSLRKIAQEFKTLRLDEIQKLIVSRVNEERLLALILLVNQFQRSDIQGKALCYQFYRDNVRYVNNWNLVDASAHLIVGAYLSDKNKDLLMQWAQSENLWERRIAIVATWYFIRHNDLVWTFKIALILLQDAEDLIQKAVGWMLREAGKRDKALLIQFLNQHAVAMPRTTLRYAIERFSVIRREHYLLKRNG